ncbi:GSCFA domain-containing protein [Capnocytophaga sputigena]
MDFRTIVPISKATKSITYYTSIVSLGSCFAVNMAQKFAYYKFPITVNPFGVLFHPLAIENILQHTIENSRYTAEDFFLHNELWHSFDFHSDMSQPSLKEAIQLANSQQIQLQQALQEASFCFITLGTAWVYIYNSTDTIVANCHKLPSQHFSKRLLSVEEITESLSHIIALLKQFNPPITIVFTISPVRHIKDGFFENQVSKSQLFAALYPLITDNKSLYFPAYELLLDELRDYRFYANDMVHPSEMAINYIWERLVATYIETTIQVDMKQVDSIQKGLSHRPFNPETESHQQFLVQLQQKMEAFTMKYPHIRF